VQDDQSKGEIVVYQSDDGRIKLDVRLQDESVRLTQPLMAEWFQTTQQNMRRHIQDIYDEGELVQEATYKKFLSVRQEGRRQVQRNLDFYNLHMIISVGYRVKSLLATRFRIWATQRLTNSSEGRICLKAGFLFQFEAVIPKGVFPVPGLTGTREPGGTGPP
jgi:hypothetical protein